MRAFKILPVEIKVKDFNLSKKALKRLEWMDWYFAHGKNARLTVDILEYHQIPSTSGKGNLVRITWLHWSLIPNYVLLID